MMAGKSGQLLRKSRVGNGLVTVVPERDKVMKYVSMDLIFQNEGQEITLGSPRRELGVVILGGQCEVSWDGAAPVRMNARMSPLEGWPHAVYIPAGRQIRLKALSKLEAAVFGAPADQGEKVQIIAPEDIKILRIGNGNWYLEGTFIIYDTIPSKRLIVGETHIPAGNWSSSPPHSHDKNVTGKETQLEEIYYFRFRPPQGFGFQGVYTLDRELEEAYIIHDGDVVLVPRGMHPNVAGPGYEMYMLWGMAGTSKDWIPFEDPAHNWIGSVRG
jgi:5-deoxy-glucuronate isomerase